MKDHGVNSLAVSPDGKTLACGVGKTVELRDVATGKRRATLTSKSLQVESLVFLPDSKRLAVAGYHLKDRSDSENTS